MKDTLFLLAPGFVDGDGEPFYCPYCTIFEGLLHLYPNLSSHIEVRRVAFPRPRSEVVAVLGEEHQSCPVLVLGQSVEKSIDGVQIQTSGTIQFIDEPQDIGHYLSVTYGIPRPH